MHQMITCKLKSSEKKIFRDCFIPKIVILPFLSQKFIHDWQVNSNCCKSSPYDKQKNLMIYNFTIFLSNLKKTQIKLYAFLNHFSIDNLCDSFPLAVTDWVPVA